MPNFALRQKGQPIDNPSLIRRRAACQVFYHVAFRNGWSRLRNCFFFANPPTHSSWAATRFSDAGNNDLTTTLRTSKMAAEVGQEVL